MNKDEKAARAVGVTLKKNRTGVLHAKCKRIVKANYLKKTQKIVI
jgi:hypothetical protein